MRILHIVSSTSNSNGVMNVIMSYYRELAKMGVQFDFAVFQKSDINYDNEIRRKGGMVYYCGGNNTFSTIIKLKAFLKNNARQYDLIENHELFLTKLLCTEKDKLILHSHTLKYSQRPLAAVRNALLCRNIEKKAGYFFSPSLKSASVFWPNKIGADNFYLIRNAIMHTRCRFTKSGRNYVRARYGVGPGELLLGYVARFDDGKNQDFLIDLLREINKKSDKYKLILVGSGKRQELIERKVQKYGLDKQVSLTGQIASEEICKYLSAMDLFLFPSKNEGLGQVAIEAQANGLNCVVSTGVPAEVKISSGVIFLPLLDKKNKENLFEWRDAVFEFSGSRQIVNIEDSNYDVVKEAEKLFGIYKRISQISKGYNL